MGATGQRRLSSLPAAARRLSCFCSLCVLSQAAASASAAPAWTTDLEKHVAFFDTDNDSIVTFSETEQGHGQRHPHQQVIGPKTRPENATTSRFDIYIANIHKGMHGSDSGSYDAQGRFVPAKFNGIFTRFAKVEPNALNEAELEAMRTANRKEGDFKGW
ncbi:hypothetical protein ZWY2020_008668 [Hordeum vulgare]|nr:hypothetical protein ZWY2020_008668 [Hordeum vulgare]